MREKCYQRGSTFTLNVAQHLDSTPRTVRSHDVTETNYLHDRKTCLASTQRFTEARALRLLLQSVQTKMSKASALLSDRHLKPKQFILNSGWTRAIPASSPLTAPSYSESRAALCHEPRMALSHVMFALMFLGSFFGILPVLLWVTAACYCVSSFLQKHCKLS